MKEWLDAAPDATVADEEFLRLLGYPPGHEPGAHVRELMDRTRAWYAARGRPWIYLRRVPVSFEGNALVLDGRPMRLPQLAAHLQNAGACEAVLGALCAGAACETEARAAWDTSRPDEYFFLETYGSAVVQHLATQLNRRLCAEVEREGLSALRHYSPGYSGWDVADQPRLFDLVLGNRQADLPEPLEVLESGMLRPKKAMLCVVGLVPSTADTASLSAGPACVACALASCQFRGAAYRHAPARIDQAPAPRPSPPRYSVGERALRKWAQERVRLETQGEGTTVALFRFDGTTCSNMGHPLSFDYRVVLGRADEGWSILEADCRPSPGDEGHALMCAWTSDAAGLMRRIAAESPPLGEPLEAALGRERPLAPSGCYCDSRGHAHKWGLALQAIHYALTHPTAAPVSIGTGRSIP